MNRSSERGNKREEEGEKRTRGKISRTRAGERWRKRKRSGILRKREQEPRA